MTTCLIILRQAPKLTKALCRPYSSAAPFTPPAFATRGAKKESLVTSESWHLSCSVLVERPARVIRDLGPLEARMSETLSAMELEGSLRSDHELRLASDAEREAKKRRGELDPAEVAVARTALDDEDDWKRERKEFTPAPVRTEADEKGDLSSVDRELRRPIRLTVKQKYGDSFIWDLPTATWRQGKEGSLRETAERAIRECCGEGLQVQVMGNAPLGYFKETYSKRMQKELGRQGQKVFLYKAIYTGGTVKSQHGVSEDFRWLTREELQELLQPKMWKALDNMLLEEQPPV